MRLLLLNLQGRGPCSGTLGKHIDIFIFFWNSSKNLNYFQRNFTKTKFLDISENTRALVRINGKRIPSNGVEYVKFDDLTMKVSVGNAKFRLENLFNGDRTLGEIGNTVINENAQLFLEEMIPGFTKSLSKTFLEIASDILHEVTYDEMFPDI